MDLYGKLHFTILGSYQAKQTLTILWTTIGLCADMDLIVSFSRLKLTHIPETVTHAVHCFSLSDLFTLNVFAARGQGHSLFVFWHMSCRRETKPTHEFKHFFSPVTSPCFMKPEIIHAVLNWCNFYHLLTFMFLLLYSLVTSLCIGSEQKSVKNSHTIDEHATWLSEDDASLWAPSASSGSGITTEPSLCCWCNMMKHRTASLRACSHTQIHIPNHVLYFSQTVWIRHYISF